MKVKIFQDIGLAGIQKVESDINDWLELPEIGEVKNSQIALCQVNNGAHSPGVECIVVTVWYEPK